ncbi:MAG: protein-glutamate O-methyltransferase CheR [Nitrospira sp.]|nr:protein-glutamate O-methyltransferase CheR [Nitrospira sp.]
MFEKEELIDLPEDVFRLLRDLIRNYCGIYFNDDSRYLLEKRLSRRVRSHHLSSFRDYYRFLLYDKSRDEELSLIIDILTVNETYFFREQGQLKTFSEEILPELKDINKEKKRLRIWSAGCSTGEEPYTIAMLVIEKGYFYGWDIEIVGSDINQRVLQVARNGVYRKNSFRTTDKYFLKKYFKEEGGIFRIANSVKQFVNFSHLNLLDPFKVKFIGIMDVLFCRNVLIYFDQPSKKKVAETFYDRLVDGGYLLLGHAESLINVTTAFTLRHFKYDMVYQKPVKQGVYISV